MAGVGGMREVTGLGRRLCGALRAPERRVCLIVACAVEKASLGAVTAWRHRRW